MCDRYVLHDAPEVLAEILGEHQRLIRVSWESMLPRYNIAPTQGVPAVRLLPIGNTREVVGLRWGLIPGWIRDPKSSTLLINARAETVLTRATFKWAYRDRRCLLPASGFYGWARRGESKQPYYFQRADKQPFCFAGLWERWENDNVEVESCALITTAANALATPVHRRMPVMLGQRHWEQWLTSPSVDGLERLLVPFPAEQMIAHPVGPQVNNLQADDPGMIAPVVIRQSVLPRAQSRTGPSTG